MELFLNKYPLSDNRLSALSVIVDARLESNDGDAAIRNARHYLDSLTGSRRISNKIDIAAQLAKRNLAFGSTSVRKAFNLPEVERQLGDMMQEQVS